MLKTASILLFTLVALPLIALKFDEPLTTLQWQMLQTSLYMMLATALLCFVVGELTGNVSQTDKLWSITPLMYTWYFAYASGWSERLIFMALLVGLWGIRLTYNFGRKGGYSWKFWEGEEDYRWSVLRRRPFLNTRLGWMLFNLLFICIYQHGLIWLFTLPAVMAVQASSGEITFWDTCIGAVFIGFLAIETIADQQQWSYQTEKYRLKKAGEKLPGEYAVGFIRTGLWSKVRHPNYAAEQAIWITFYFFSVASTGRWINWSMAGCLLLMLLFQGSSDFSEAISAEKYPLYKEYQKKVGRFFPKLFSKAV
jgi:steroid 5-alpha reductase family enzyme